MLRKISGAWRILRSRGPVGVIRRIGWYANRWWTSDHWWLGRIVELTGNHAVVDGVRFDLSSPLIGTPQKAGFLLRNYEYGERAALQFIPLDIGLPLVEFGGSIGAMACSSSKHFGNPERHVVVEANPYMIPVLTGNRDLNGCRFQVLHAALAYNPDEVTFHVHPKFVKSSLYMLDATAEAVNVPAVTLRHILERFHFDGPIVLFCDVEGAEVGLFDHEADLMRGRVAYLALEVHAYLTGRESVERMLAALAEWGFRQLYQRGDNYLFRNETL